MTFSYFYPIWSVYQSRGIKWVINQNEECNDENLSDLINELVTLKVNVKKEVLRIEKIKFWKSLKFEKRLKFKILKTLKIKIIEFF